MNSYVLMYMLANLFSVGIGMSICKLLTKVMAFHWGLALALSREYGLVDTLREKNLNGKFYTYESKALK